MTFRSCRLLMMTRSIVVLLSFMLCEASVFGQSFQIATCNINYANADLDQVVRAVTEADVDMICLQETTLNSEAYLIDALEEQFPNSKIAGHEGKYPAERFMILSTEPINQFKFNPPNVGLFGFCKATTKLKEQNIDVIVTHLSPFLPKNNATLSSTNETIESTEAVHAVEVEEIIGAVDEGRPTLVVGDFNSLAIHVAPKKLLEARFVDAQASLGAEVESIPTWTWPTRAIPLLLRIDYVFHSSHFKATKVDVVRILGSDHSMVVADLTIKMK
jgi:endonuclease/exonuclease/phosphatase family metal-dependent hydrolase